MTAEVKLCEWCMTLNARHHCDFALCDVCFPLVSAMGNMRSLVKEHSTAEQRLAMATDYNKSKG